MSNLLMRRVLIRSCWTTFAEVSHALSQLAGAPFPKLKVMDRPWIESGARPTVRN